MPLCRHPHHIAIPLRVYPPVCGVGQARKLGKARRVGRLPSSILRSSRESGDAGVVPSGGTGLATAMLHMVGDTLRALPGVWAGRTELALSAALAVASEGCC